MTSLASINSALIAAQQLAYKPNGFVCTNVVNELESADYAACDFQMNNKYIKFRAAKITPTKQGLFVTLWKRINGTGPILPYDSSDVIDFVVISVRSGNHFGQFVFPKSILIEKGVLSKNGTGGKRAIRVYPPWDHVESKQAQTTQAWQVKYFFEISTKWTDLKRVHALFSV